MPSGNSFLRTAALQLFIAPAVLFTTDSLARTITVDTPSARFEAPDAYTAKSEQNEWTFSPPGGGAAITFQVRPMAARGGPYSSAEQAAKVLAENVKAKMQASILKNTPHKSPHYTGHYLEFSWQNQGTTLQNIEIFFESDGRLLNFTLIAPQATVEKYRGDFLAMAGSLQPTADAAMASSPVTYTAYVDDVTGLRIPLPATWRRTDKPDKLLFYNPEGDDISSLLIQHLDSPPSTDDPALEITSRLYLVLQKNASFKDVEAKGKVEANGLNLYVVSAVNTGMKRPGKDVFIQVAGKEGKVASINLTIDLAYADRTGDLLGKLLHEVRTDVPVADHRTEPAAPTDSESLVEIRGVVKHGFGSAAGGVEVTITLITSFDPLSGTVIATTKTDSRGHYTFKVRGDLPYLVHAGASPEAYNRGGTFAGRRLVDLAREAPPASLDITLARKR